MNDIAIEVDQVSKSFGKIKALDAVSFQVPSRSVFGLLGPNGAGKTTLFSVAANFLKADQGSIRILGIDIQRISELQGRLTILPQDAQFQKNVPILDQLAFFRLLDGRPLAEARQEVQQTLDLVGIGGYAKRGVHALSHGMQKRLGIAQAFLGQPEVILLDEPTAGLDPANAKQIRDLVSELSQRATVVVSSHNLAEIEELCDHVAILDHGKVVTFGPVEELTRGEQELEIAFAQSLTGDDQGTLLQLPVVQEIRESGPQSYTLQLTLGDGSRDQAVSQVLRALLDRDLVPRRMDEGKSLENHFLRVTNRESGANGPPPPPSA